jgi:hypothetical protein
MFRVLVIFSVACQALLLRGTSRDDPISMRINARLSQSDVPVRLMQFLPGAPMSAAGYFTVCFNATASESNVFLQLSTWGSISLQEIQIVPTVICWKRYYIVPNATVWLIAFPRHEYNWPGAHVMGSLHFKMLSIQ